MPAARHAGSAPIAEPGRDGPGVSLILDLQPAGPDDRRTRQAEAELVAEAQNASRDGDPLRACGEAVLLLDDPSSLHDPSIGLPMLAGPLAFAAPHGFAVHRPDCGQALFAG